MYGSPDGFRTYHTARNRDVSAYTDDDEVNGALLVASEWIDARYREAFPGLKVGMRAQIFEWPRIGAWDVYGYAIDPATVPTEVENATYEVALRQLQNPGQLAVDYTPSKYSRVAIAGSVSVDYATLYSASEVQTRIQIVDDILSNILSPDQSYSMLSGERSRT